MCRVVCRVVESDGVGGSVFRRVCVHGVGFDLIIDIGAGVDNAELAFWRQGDVEGFQHTYVVCLCPIHKTHKL